MLRAGGRFILAAVALIVVTMFVASGFAQNADDPRNTKKEYFDAINGAKCYSHHGGEGFRPMDVSLKERFSQLPIGEVINLEVDIKNPWKHTVQGVSVVVNTTNAPNVRVITPDTINNTALRSPVTLEAGGKAYRDSFSVQDSATELYVGAFVKGEPVGSDIGMGLEQGELSLRVSNAADTELPVEGSRYAQMVRLSGKDLLDAGTGEFHAEVKWDTDVREIDGQMDVEVVMMVNYTVTATEFTFRMPQDFQVRPESEGSVVVPIVLESEEEAVLDIRVQSISYWAHSPTDAAPRDDGLFYRFMTMKVRGGDSIVRLDSFAPQPTGPVVDLYNLFTRILGFAAALLIPMSMLTGGVFGKGSRRWLNKVTGGAKKRVLWHSAMSWIILAIASFHFIIALVEAKFVWSKGLLWGGLGWALLISLGFTGYYQVRMIKRWNYKVWRHTHLWSAVAVLVFTLIHLTLDGSDLAAVRDMLPGWHEKLVWP